MPILEVRYDGQKEKMWVQQSWGPPEDSIMGPQTDF